MKAFVPKVIRQQIFTKCGSTKNVFAHNREMELFNHDFQPRLETIAEAYYRAGLEKGSRDTADRIHWGEGW